MTSHNPKIELFDRWSADYDLDVQSSSSEFPFAGYEQVLFRIVKEANSKDGTRVLDIGSGTGELSSPFAWLGCETWGVDFSKEMIALASSKVPQAKFIHADLLTDWTVNLPHPIEVVVSSYTFHEFDTKTKLRLIEVIFNELLAEEGQIIIGDIAFPTAQIHDLARTK
jgi:putative AdoMet-dependent methyltransferase